jgi:uncharacterized protein
MKLNNILQAFVPKENKFFVLFEEATKNLETVSDMLVEMMNETDIEKRHQMIAEIERLEHKGDLITHEIFHELSSSFITPFDREDIHSLATSIDDILDYMHGSAKRIELYNVKTISKAMKDISALIKEGNDELRKAILGLKSSDNFKEVLQSCVKINSIENRADDVYDRAIGWLFDTEKDAISLIRDKEVLQNLETATDKCEDAANVIESIIVKYS